MRNSQLQYTPAADAASGVATYSQKLSLVATLYASPAGVFEPKARAARYACQQPLLTPLPQLTVAHSPHHASQEYAFKAQAAPKGVDASGATFARARLDLARYATAEGVGGASDIELPLALCGPPAPGAPPCVLRVSVATAWLKRVEADEDALSDVSGMSARAFGSPTPAPRSPHSRVHTRRSAACVPPLHAPCPCR